MINKGIRFAILERDDFTCQYCGRTPPDVVLEVDHIHSLVNGGKEDSTNLITSCLDCNRGKSGKSVKLLKPPREIPLPSSEKFHYKVFSFRVSEDIIDGLKEGRLRSGKSWNLYVQELLDNHNVKQNKKDKDKHL